MKTAEYIDHVKAQRKAALERETVVRAALKRFLFLHLRQKDGAKIREESWDEAIVMAQEALCQEENT